jgi:hypothetical protein
MKRPIGDFQTAGHAARSPDFPKLPARLGRLRAKAPEHARPASIWWLNLADLEKEADWEDSAASDGC